MRAGTIESVFRVVLHYAWQFVAMREYCRAEIVYIDTFFFERQPDRQVGCGEERRYR